MKTFHINPAQELELGVVENILADGLQIGLSEDAIKRIASCRDYLENRLKVQKEPIYGLNTGFGSLCNEVISGKNLKQLQKNLVMSHASGTGEEVPQEIVKLMLLLKVQGLSYGNSGIRLETVQRLIDFYNKDVVPVIYQQGSLGASGDLAPLAHMSLPLIGMGEVYYKGKKESAEKVLKQLKWKPLELEAKEGLALLNGTQFMSAYGVWCLNRMKHLTDWADFIAAVSLDAFDCHIEPFEEAVHAVRAHKGQVRTASFIRSILRGSKIVQRKKKQVQDPYSFRCIPQVHGASKDALLHIMEVVTREINSVTDNPTVLPEDDMIISAGNFHGQHMAMTMDYLAIAAAELGSISERRTFKLISGQRGLPPFLVSKPGLNSGFMIPQYTAASIVSQNKQFCTPASVDTIDSSNGQEDHVSMGANAAVKALKVVDNLGRIIAIELFNAAQAMDFRRPGKSSPVVEEQLENYRKTVPFIKEDCPMYTEISKTVDYITKNPAPVSSWLR